MQSQQLIRNNKQYTFFPDVTIEDVTRGFMMPHHHQFLSMLQGIWDTYCAEHEEGQCFSVYVSRAELHDKIHRELFANYLAVPTTLLVVVGKVIPMHSVIIRKKRVSAI